MTTCKFAKKHDGHMYRCHFTEGHLGEHDYKRYDILYEKFTSNDDEHDISLEGALLGFGLCTGGILLFVVSTYFQLIPSPSWINPLVWIISIITVFSLVGWLVCLHSIIFNLWYRNKSDTFYLYKETESYYANTWEKINHPLQSNQTVIKP